MTQQHLRYHDPNDVVYLDSQDGLYALNATTGALLWNYTGGSPTVANGVVHVSNGNNIYALDASTGANLWNYTIGGAVGAISNGVVYVNGGGNLYAIGNGSGRQTTLIMAITPTTVLATQQFNVTGTLNTTDATPIAGATTQLQRT